MSLILRSLSATYGDGHCIDRHSHPWGQLAYASGGAMSVSTEDVAWLVPPARAVWLPPLVRHSLTMRGRTRLKTIYLSPERSAGLATSACGLEVSALLRELILHVVRLGALDDDVPHEATLAALLVDLLAEAGRLPLQLRMPSDPRAVRAASLIRREPARPLSLPELAAAAGASGRTLQRLFLSQTGLHIAAWRQAARLSHAAVRLLDGASVTAAGAECGYASTSAFISAFRKRTGLTPLAYRAARHG